MLRILTFILFAAIAFPCMAQTDPVGSGQAMYFDGVDDFVDLGDIFDDTTFPFSITAWIYIDPSYTGSCPIFTSQDDDRLYNGFWFHVSQADLWLGCGDGRGENHPAFRSGRQAKMPTPAGGRWIHIAGVARSERDIDLYLNGIALPTFNYGDGTERMKPSSPGISARVGTITSNGIVYFHHGAIDDLRVYDVALTAAQVRDGMCRKPQGADIPKLGYWSFDETSGTQTLDASGKNQHATVRGARRDFSNAPLGDMSTYAYPISANTDVVLNVGDHHIQVRTGTAVEGVHFYEVNHIPSQTGGLPAPQLQQPYFGVFIASATASRSFRVTDMFSGATCTLYTRPGNATPTWTLRPDLLGLTDRIEFIRDGNNLIPPVELGADVLICNADYYDLSVTLPSTGSPAVVWNTGQVTPTIRVNHSGTYRVEIYGECNSVRDSLRIRFDRSPPSFSLGSDSILCVFTPKALKPSRDMTGYEIRWQDGSQEASLVATDFGSYWLQVSNACGISADTVKFSRPDFSGYTLPNVITPGNDGLNETFQVHPILDGASFWVFNRWGQEVYYTPTYHNEWDGANLAGGVYYYRLLSPCIGEWRGTVSILR